MVGLVNDMGEPRAGSPLGRRGGGQRGSTGGLGNYFLTADSKDEP